MKQTFKEVTVYRLASWLAENILSVKLTEAIAPAFI